MTVNGLQADLRTACNAAVKLVHANNELVLAKKAEIDDDSAGQNKGVLEP